MSSNLYEQNIRRNEMSENTVKNYYELLAIAPDATAGEIEGAFSQARSNYVKDTTQPHSLSSREERESFLKELHEAYNTLRDPLRRAAYNAKLKPSVNYNLVGVSDGNLLRLHTPKNEPPEKEVEKYVTLKKSLSVMDDRDPATAEQFRILYTKIEHINKTRSYKSFAVTSALQGEGKTSTSFNLAYIIASEFKKKVLLIDADLRKPSIKTYLQDRDPASGLIDIVKGDADISDATVRLKGSSLYIITSGGNTRNSSELLSSERISNLIGELKEQYDYILIDSPPIISLADMNIISKLVDATILVVKAGKTPKDIVKKAVDSLSGRMIAGVVLNCAETVSKKHNYYY